jgi:hypothetical protein
MDIYSSLIGKAPSKKEEQKAIADALRRKRAFGELATLTGDKVLQPFGKEQLDMADKAAKQLQETRLADVDNDQTAAYQTGQLQHMGGVLDESIRSSNMRDATTRRGQDISLLAATLRAAGKGKAPPRLRVSDIKNLQDLSQDIGSMQGLEKFLGEGGKFGAVEIGGVPIPGSRSLSNALASRGLGSKEAKKSFLAKQEFDRLYTLGARNRLFGATLTPNEQTAWENANPSIRQSDEQIAEAIPILRKVLQQRLKNMGAGLAKEGYNAEAIGEYSSIPGLELPVAGEIPGEPAASGTPAPATEQPTVRQKRIKELKEQLGL